MVSVYDINLARERRSSIIKMLIDKKNLPVVSFKLNIPGERKKIKFSDEIFNEGINLIKEVCLESIMWSKILDEITGNEFFASVDMDPLKLKILLTDIEDNHLLGRLFDIDVTSTEGNSIKRKDIGKPERLCFLCDKLAFECARSRNHSIEEILNWIENISVKFFNK